MANVTKKGASSNTTPFVSNIASIASNIAADIVSEKEIERLATFGLNLGMAFQIVDDALDFAPESVTGKPIGGDLRERKCTPPIFMYAQSLDAAKRKEFEAKFAVVPTPVFETNGNVKVNNTPSVGGKSGANFEINTEKGFTENELTHIIQEIIDNKYPEKTKELANSYLEKAEEALNPFSGEHCELLLQALHYVRARTK